MGTRVASRRDIVVIANTNILGSSVVLPSVELKMLVTVVPQNAGILSVVRIDGVTQKVSKMFAGSALAILANNLDEISSPKFYSEIPDEIRYNFRYSVNTIFDIFTVYTEKEHAGVLLV